MKLLLYCTNGKPYLHKAGLEKWWWNEGVYEPFYYIEEFFTFDKLHKLHRYKDGDNDVQISQQLNGKIVAQCNCEKVDLICPDFNYLDASCKDGKGFILYKACLTRKDLVDYGKGKYLYALHLSNLEVFNNPKDLSDFGVKTAPQNIRKVFDDNGNEYVLISIRPNYLANILNGKKTIEVRKKILKCMGGLGR